MFSQPDAVRLQAVCQQTVAFQAIDTKTATILLKAIGRLFLPATIAENGRCIHARIGWQDFEL